MPTRRKCAWIASGQDVSTSAGLCKGGLDVLLCKYCTQILHAERKSQIAERRRLAPPGQGLRPLDKKPGAFAQFGRERGDDAVFDSAPFEVGAVDRFLGGGQRFHSKRVTDYEGQRRNRYLGQFLGRPVMTDEIHAAAIEPDQRAAWRCGRRPAGETAEPQRRLLDIADRNNDVN